MGSGVPRGASEKLVSKKTVNPGKRTSKLCRYACSRCENCTARLDFGSPGRSHFGRKSRFWGSKKTWTLQKFALGGGPEQIRTLVPKIMQNSSLFEGPEPRLALYSSLILQFLWFSEGVQKHDKMVSKKRCFFIINHAPGFPWWVKFMFFRDFWWYWKSVIFSCHHEAPKNDKKNNCYHIKMVPGTPE